MRIEKCGWKKNADNQKSKRKKTRNADGKKRKKINKQTIKERNLFFQSLSQSMPKRRGSRLAGRGRGQKLSTKFNKQVKINSKTKKF